MAAVQGGDDWCRKDEVWVVPGADAQELRWRLVASGAAIQRLEMVQTSLHQIFMQKVGAEQLGIEEGMSGHG